MSQTKAQLVTGITISGSANEVAFDGGPLFEKCNVTAGKLSDNTNIDLANGIHIYLQLRKPLLRLLISGLIAVLL